MNIVPTKEQILREILLGLADQFESGSTHWRWFKPGGPEEFEPLRECLAEMVSERWLVQHTPHNAYRFTPEGYKHYRPQIRALRVLGNN